MDETLKNRRPRGDDKQIDGETLSTNAEAVVRQTLREPGAWTTPELVELPIGMYSSRMFTIPLLGSIGETGTGRTLPDAALVR
jgi:hypothetical protein